MRVAGFVIVAALAACATPQQAAADPFEAAHPELLRGCVEDAGVERAALETCVGALARPCVVEDGGATSSHVLCWSAEYDVWRALISEAEAQVNARESAKDPARLAAANAAWAAWLEAECEYWAWEVGGGSGEQVERVQCAARVTADRAITLIRAAAR